MIKQNISVCFAHNLMKSRHRKIGSNVPNVCSGVAIDIQITLAKNFLCAIFVAFNFFDITMYVKKCFCLIFLRSELHILILEIQNKDKNYLKFTWGKTDTL